MKFLVLFALCISAALAELPLELPLEEQVLPETHEALPEVVPETHEVEHVQEELADLCKERGVFANPNDPESRTFIRCELEPIELQCDEGFIFSEEKLMCVEKPQPVVIDLNAVNFADFINCDNVADKYYRNPYDCSKFYRCYTQGEFRRVDFMTCVSSMIFDEVLETCLPAEQFKSLYSAECHNAPLPELTKEKAVPEEQVPEETQPELEVPVIPIEETNQEPEVIPELEPEVPIEPLPETEELPQPVDPEQNNENPIEELPIELNPIDEHQLPEQSENLPIEEILEHSPIDETQQVPEVDPEQSEIPTETEIVDAPAEHAEEEIKAEEKKPKDLNEILASIKDLFSRGL